MYCNDDPYYIDPEKEAELERRAEVEALEKEHDEAQRIIYGDEHCDASYWKAVERAAEIRERLKVLESSTQP